MIEKTVWDAMHTEQVHLDGVKVILHDFPYPIFIAKCMLWRVDNVLCVI